MVVNTAKRNNPEGLSPNVDNTTNYAKPTGGQKAGYAFLLALSWLFILPGVIWMVARIGQKNRWIEHQMEINNAAGAIDVNLTKRCDTLKKLLDQAKGYLKHERETLERVTSMRSFAKSPEAIVEADRTISALARNIQIAVEKYPDLKANALIGELMSASQYIEAEIAASRRLYNRYVQRFNADILVFPKVCYAARQRLHTLPLFAASEQQKQDVDMGSLHG